MQEETGDLVSYALRFPGEEVWALRLLALIVGEQACCPFFTVELVFEPEPGPIRLHLRGPEDTSAFLAATTLMHEALLCRRRQDRAGGTALAMGWTCEVRR